MTDYLGKSAEHVVMQSIFDSIEVPLKLGVAPYMQQGSIVLCGASWSPSSRILSRLFDPLWFFTMGSLVPAISRSIRRVYE